MTDDNETSPRFLRALAREGPLGGGNLRAAVMGVNDGLISNFSIVMGVAGGVDSPTIVMLAGIAGLLAGGFSMAAGEYISVGSQRDVYLHQTRDEDEEDGGGSGSDARLIGSPWGAAFSSFAAFVIGAFVPIAPYLANLGGLSFYLSAALSAAALLAVGGLIAVGSGRSVVWGAARMLLVGSLAAAATYGAGWVVGGVVGG